MPTPGSATRPISDIVVNPHPEPARVKQWTDGQPSNLVKPDSGHRNHIFYVGEPVVFKLGGAAQTYEVRDYWGDLIDQGTAGAETTLRVKQPGWYKLYLYGTPVARALHPGTPPDPNEARRLWGDTVGGTNFVIFRRDPHFPPLPEPGIPELAGDGTIDEVLRGVTGMGPQRHAADADHPDESIRKLDAQIAIDRKLYLPYDPARKRVLLIAFSKGTKNLDGVRRIVEHFKNDVRYWEPRNEPNYGSTGADFAVKEMKPFYDTVKSVDPALRVLGPGTVTVGPRLQGWIEDFLKAGGAKSIDGFSFHAYNNVNGDLWLARKALDTLNAQLKRYGADTIEKWQTEQGYMAAVYGSYQPRLQGRWTMLQMMAYEQYGIPKEHNHLWYDQSHGYWNEPMFFENNDGSLNPAAPLMRVWSEELYGLHFTHAFDFGTPGNQLYLGSLFTGSGRAMAAFMSTGSPYGRVRVRVSRGNALRLISAFGVESTVPVRDGEAVLPVPELPVYVELAHEQSLEVLPTNWGPNLAREPGVTVATSAPPDPVVKKNNVVAKVINGELENWYWNFQPDSSPWTVDKAVYPITVDLRFPAPKHVSRVVIYAAPPWQFQGTLLDYELQCEEQGRWVPIERVTEPPRTFSVFSATVRCSVDSFFSDRWTFEHHFKPITTAAIRLVIHNATHGGGATALVPEAGGQAWGPQLLSLREIEVYSR